MVKFIQKWSLGWVGVYMYRTRAGKHRLIDAFMRRYIGVDGNRSLDPTFVREYERAISNTRYWHGTGRYQYGDNGVQKPVFETILKVGALLPNYDVFDISQGAMTSVSCTNIRTYARIYADMHQYQGVRKGQRNGAPFFWAYYYIVSSALMAVGHMRLWMNVKKRHDAARKVKNDVKLLWARKIMKRDFQSLKDVFVNGSDIDGNFGVLIGLKNLPSTTPTSPFISMYETRCPTNIPVLTWTHLEVPAKQLQTIRGFLQENSTSKLSHLPVFAIEDCELYWSQKKFSELIRDHSEDNTSFS